MTKVEEARKMFRQALPRTDDETLEKVYDAAKALELAVREEERAATHGWCNAEIARLREDVFKAIVKRDESLRAERVRVLKEVRVCLGYGGNPEQCVERMLSEAREASGMVGDHGNRVAGESAVRARPDTQASPDVAAYPSGFGSKVGRPPSEQPRYGPQGQCAHGMYNGCRVCHFEQPEQERCPRCDSPDPAMAFVLTVKENPTRLERDKCGDPWHSRKEDK